MNIKKRIQRMLPSFIKAKLAINKDREELDKLQFRECKTENLRLKSEISLNDIFTSKETDSLWVISTRELEQFTIPDGTGGVNPGDRRAIYYLINELKPKSILEIGTHIGASTIHIASALYMSQIKNGIDASLTTADIADVNSIVDRNWVRQGSSHAPIEMVKTLNYGSFVEFITDNSIHFLANNEKKYDFIFLDGDHSARTVYQEVPLALNLLNKNGVILLHDYFPNLNPLWSDGSVIPGPFLATERQRKEGANISVLPLGGLPWPTKLQSNVTSLALLVRNQ